MFFFDSGKARSDGCFFHGSPFAEILLDAIILARRLLYEKTRLPMSQFSTEEFWQFSITHYQDPAVKSACLLLQDTACADVNLLLLAIWLKTKGVRVSKQTVDELLTTSQYWQAEKIGPLRSHRRLQSKQSDGYRAALMAELEAEEDEQAALVQCLNNKKSTGPRAIDFWEAYSQKLGVSDSQRNALIGFI